MTANFRANVHVFPKFWIKYYNFESAESPAEGVSLAEPKKIAHKGIFIRGPGTIKDCS